MNDHDFFGLYRRPEWQKKRLEVLEAAEFTCQGCGAADRTLHVHHRYYTKGAAPWEYPDEALQCLCEDCHEDATERAAAAKRAFGMLDASSQTQVIAYMRTLIAREAGADVVAFGSVEELTGVADAFGIEDRDVWYSAIEHPTGPAFPRSIDTDSLYRMRSQRRTGRVVESVV